MKHKKFLYTFLPLLALTLVGAGAASAHGMLGFGKLSPEEFTARHQTMFETKAKILGASVDEIKNAWAEGKSFADLAKEKGITEEQLRARMKEAHLAELKTGLQTLVDKGVITQAQADQRLTLMQSRMDQMKTKMGKHFFRGF